jgi:hypothetical protein
MRAMPSRSLTVFRWTMLAIGIFTAVEHLVRLWQGSEIFRYYPFVLSAIMCGGSSYGLYKDRRRKSPERA